MQQEERRRLDRPGLPVEDGKPIDLCGAIESRMFHKALPPDRPCDKAKAMKAAKAMQQPERNGSKRRNDWLTTIHPALAGMARFWTPAGHMPPCNFDARIANFN